MTGTVRVGISGWTYPPWRGVFYPPGLRQNNELEYAASQMSSIEINGSFYSLQRPNSYRSWADRTPAEYVFAVKGGRFITHMKKLANAETPLANFFASGLLTLGDKLGPILWQLPPTCWSALRSTRSPWPSASPISHHGESPARQAVTSGNWFGANGCAERKSGHHGFMYSTRGGGPMRLTNHREGGTT